MTLFAFRLIFALDSVLASYKAMMIAEGDDSESDNLEVNDGMYLDIYLIEYSFQNIALRCVLPVSFSVDLLLPYYQVHQKAYWQNAPLCTVS